MIKPLRKRHRQIWLAWAILLPAAILFAWLAIPNQPAVKLLQQASAELLPVVIKTKEAKDYTINIRSNKENSQWQLEWQNKTVLAVPSAVIYRVNNNQVDITKNELVGRIEAKNDYVFPLTTAPGNITEFRLLLYDFIHEKIIDSINFQP